MRKFIPTLAALCATLLSPVLLQAPLAQAATPTAAATVQTARVIVKYKATTADRAQAQSASGRGAAVLPQRAQALSQRFGIAMTDGRAIADRTQVVFAQGLTSAELAARLAADPEVEYAEPDQRRFVRAAPNDPLYPNGQSSPFPLVGQWYLRAPDANAPAAIDAEGAWQVTKGTSSVVVAVLDTGVRFDHPDLVGRLYPGYDFVESIAAGNDGDGVDPDASDPGDWLTATEVINNPEFADCAGAIGNSGWHGTEVAGIIGAATGNGRGIASVAPNVMVLPVRVLGKCGGFDSDIIAGMRWAAGLSASPVPNPHPARVLNLSLGAAGACSNSYRQVFTELTSNSVVVVVSAGNSDGFATDSPANCPGAIAVAGLRHIGTKVGYSNVGSEIAISAPAGNCINTGPNDPCEYTLVTTRNLGVTTPGSNSYSDKFNDTLGTSFSAPMVAATSALMLSVTPSLVPADVRRLLRNSATPFPTTGAAAGTPFCHAPNGAVQSECYCTTTTCGAGMLNVNAALQLAVQADVPYVPVGSSTANAAVGQNVTLDGSQASVATGGNGTFSWSLVSGDAVFVGATDQDTAVIQGRSNGYVTVRLTVTDTLRGLHTDTDTTVLIGPAITQSASPSSGGGAVGAGWLALLGLAVLALRRTGRRAA